MNDPHRIADAVTVHLRPSFVRLATGDNRRELEISVKINGYLLQVKKVVPPTNDTISYIEMMLDYAKQEVLNALKPPATRGG